jgi:hypothetical protein
MNSPVVHPSEVLPVELLNSIRAEAEASESHRQLTAALLNIIYEEGWFKLMVPRIHSGLQLSLPNTVRLEEGLSWADGSLGWVVTLCSGAGWFAGFFPQPLSARLFSDRDACVAGSGSPTGEAEVSANGYTVSGTWRYASGAPHATAFTANCQIRKEGKLLLDKTGNPVIRPFLFYRDEVRVHNTWNPVGLIATASHAFEVSELRVQLDRCFEINLPGSWAKDPLYSFPFLQMAEATLAANVSGMTLHFIDLFAALITEKCRIETFQERKWEEIWKVVGDGKKQLHQLRLDFYSSLDQSWLECSNAKQMQGELLDKLSTACHNLAYGCRSFVDQIYPYAGMGAVSLEKEINRVWRDLHTASQHPLLVFRHPF